MDKQEIIKKLQKEQKKIESITTNTGYRHLYNFGQLAGLKKAIKIIKETK